MPFQSSYSRDGRKNEYGMCYRMIYREKYSKVQVKGNARAEALYPIQSGHRKPLR